MLPKDLSPNKIKTVVSNSYLKSYQQLMLINHIDHVKIYMTLLVHKNF